MKNSKEHIWYTGDWKSKNNDQPPYNGLQIKAKANYSAPTNPPSTQKLKDVELEIIDFTHNEEGASSKVKLKETNLWYEIPTPKNRKETSEESNIDFTVVANQNKTLGKVKLDHNSTGIHLNIQFRYGMPGMTREELGYVMKFDSIYNDKHDPIEVED